MGNKITVLILLLSVFITGNLFAQSVGINNPTPAPSALLDLTSTSKGLLTPRMTTAQRLAILSPATGLIVYDITLNQFYYFDGATWRPLTSNNSVWNLAGNAGINSGNNFLGTTDNKPLRIRTNNIERMIVDSTGKVGVGTNFPRSSLEVSSASNVITSSFTSGILNINSMVIPGPDDGPSITLSHSSAMGYVLASIEARTTITPCGCGGGGGGSPANNGDLVFKTLKSFNTNVPTLYEHMRITYDGNVGIGTSTPSAQLSVARTVGVDDILTLADANNSLVVGTDFDLPLFIRIRPTNGAGIAITNNGDAVGLFVKSDASANVGIATASPVSTLDINGSYGSAIRSTSLNTALTINDHTLFIPSTVAVGITISLPTATSCEGREYIIVNQSSFSCSTFPGYISLTGSTSSSIAVNNSITLQSNGVSWIRIR